MYQLWSFVRNKATPRWLWVALCRRRRQVAAFVLGDWSEPAYQSLGRALPEAYRRCQRLRDFWRAYAAVFRRPTQSQVRKASGEWVHMER